MRNRLVVALAIMMTAILLMGCAVANRPQTIVQALYPLYTDTEMVEKSAAIVLAKVVKKGGLYEEDKVTFTEFTINVLRSFKGDLSGQVTITYDGSDSVVYEGNPLPVEGREYIFFLHRVPENSRLVLLSGPWSRFDSKGGKFVSLASPEVSLSLDQFKLRFGLAE